jgi:DNA-binding NarL/FixJ family response regulator
MRVAGGKSPTVKAGACVLGGGELLVHSELSDSIQQRSMFGKRVLLAEDDYLLAFDLHDELIARGAEVIGPVGDLDQAYELAKSEPRIDAAVIDLNLHGEFAFHLVDQLIRRDVPVVFSTAYDGDVVPYRLRHIARYSKPVPASEIVQGIADLIAERRSAEA